MNHDETAAAGAERRDELDEFFTGPARMHALDEHCPNCGRRLGYDGHPYGECSTASRSHTMAPGAKCPRCHRPVGYDGHPYGECTADVWLLQWTPTDPWADVR